MTDPRHSAADISRARRLLGFEPAFRLEDKIDEVIQWNASLKGQGVFHGS